MTIQTGSNLTGAVSQNGGVTSYRVGQDAAPVHNPLTEAWQAAGRANSPSVSFDASTGETRESGIASFTVGAQAHGAGDSVMSTFRSGRDGGSVEIEPGNPASRTSMAVAKRMGLITDGTGFRDTAGFNQPVGPATQAGPAASEELQAPEGHSETPEAFDAAEYAAFEADIADMPQVAYDTTVSVAVAACLDGGSLAAATTRLARESGMEPARAAQYVENIHGMYRDTVLRAVIPEGVRNPEAFFTWCRSQRGLQDAISTLTVQRDVSKFKSLAREYSAYQARHSGVNS